MKQEQRLYEAPKGRDMTGLEILWECGIYRASEIIRRLREKHTIDTNMVEMVTREGKTRVARYHLVQ